MPPHSSPKSEPSPPTPRAVVERWALVSAKDIMRTDVITVPYSTPLSEVERILSDNRISGAPVTDEAGHIVGIVSLKDIIDRYAEDPDARPRRGHGFYHLSSEDMLEEDSEVCEIPEEAEENAEDVMSAEIYSVDARAGLKDIAAVMSKHRIHRVLVEEDGRYVGLLSATEILDALNA